MRFIDHVVSSKLLMPMAWNIPSHASMPAAETSTAPAIRRLAGGYRAKLGESPVWTDDGRLAFVDIVAKELLCIDPAAADEIPKRTALPTTPGCLVRSKKGGLLVALTMDDAASQPGGRLCRVHPPSSTTPDASVDDPSTSFMADVLNKNMHPPLDDDATPGAVLNDGAVDARGRVWVGSKLLSKTTQEPGSQGQPLGAVFCVESAFAFRGGELATVGSVQVVREIGGVHTSNGIGWSPDGCVMYHVDSPRRRVDAYDFDVNSGMLTSPRVFCEVAEPGVPDGLAVDLDGGVWVCVWDGGRVERYMSDESKPNFARLDRTLDFKKSVNVTRPTSCCFGEGDFSETLFFTSCALDTTVDSNAIDLSSEQPNAGAVFAVDVGVKGVDTHAASF